MSVVKVWPLVDGLKGFDANGNEIDLQPGCPRWMEEESAHAAEKAWEVQLMAGLDTTQLKDPKTADIKAEKTPTPQKKATSNRKPSTYNRRDIKAE